MLEHGTLINYHHADVERVKVGDKGFGGGV